MNTFKHVKFFFQLLCFSRLHFSIYVINAFFDGIQIGGCQFDFNGFDIARRIGSSPATFYQYFKDVEDVVLCLAGQAKEATPILVEIIDGNWEGPAGLERGKQLANLVIEHWEKYAPELAFAATTNPDGYLGAFFTVRHHIVL